MTDVKIYTEDGLMAYAEQHIFPNYEGLQKLLATPDGQFFTERAKNDATNYAREAKLPLVVIERLKGGLHVAPAESDDPGVREQHAVMQALSCTQDQARELIQHYHGNVGELLTEQRKIRTAAAAAAVEPIFWKEAPADNIQKVPIECVADGTLSPPLTQEAPAKPPRVRKTKTA